MCCGSSVFHFETAANAHIAEYDYAYYADGQKTSATEDFWLTNNGQNVEVTNNISYTYDALNRLIDEAFVTNAEQILGLDPSLPTNVKQWQTFTDQYTYDLDSNQLQKATELGSDQTPDKTIVSAYDANDRLMQQVDTTSGGSTTTQYSYNNTEQTTQSVYPGTPSTLGTILSSRQYQYDLQGRMSVATVTSYTNSAASQVERQTYGYDANGLRVSVLDQIAQSAGGQWTTQTLTEYLNESNNFTGYSQVVRETQTDAVTGQIQRVTEYTIGLRQISQTSTLYTSGHPGTPITLHFGFDRHGSVRVLLNAAGALATVAGVRQIFNYDAYGKPVGFNAKAAATHLLYNGEQTDVATGLQYLRARYYSTTSGAFTTLDPYGGNQTNPVSYNKYLYAQGNAINRRDPTGRLSYVEIGAALAIGAVVVNLSLEAYQGIRKNLGWKLTLYNVGRQAAIFGLIAGSIFAPPPLNIIAFGVLLGLNIYGLIDLARHWRELDWQDWAILAIQIATYFGFAKGVVTLKAGAPVVGSDAPAPPDDAFEPLNTNPKPDIPIAQRVEADVLLPEEAQAAPQGGPSGDTYTVYHGTGALSAEAIKSQGLNPPGGGDFYATTDPATALKYGNNPGDGTLSLDGKGIAPAVLRLKIPKGVFDGMMNAGEILLDPTVENAIKITPEGQAVINEAMQ